jgi:glycerol-3-phosphate dehydrogenase
VSGVISAADRPGALERLAGTAFDVVVVGGGIVGAGVALDAAARGLRTALVERGDLASGTSSRSSRQVHGGLRYLAHGELGLVRESLAERRTLAALAPHLVRPVQMLVPLRRRAWRFRLALGMYDALGAHRSGRHRRERRNLPELAVGDVLSYPECAVDDARLTLAVARTAAREGATVATYVEVAGIEDGRDGVRLACRDIRGGARIDVDARAVVNAAGVWSDAVRALADTDAVPQLRPARGTHVVLPRERLPYECGLVLPCSGGEFCFTLPWNDVVIVGTTDVAHDGPLDDPQPTDGEIDGILGRLNEYTVEPVSRDEIVGAYAGLRPLLGGAGGRTADLSRRSAVARSGRVVTVAGGKLTTYRRSAAAAVDALAELLGPLPATPTATLPLAGALASPRTALERRHGTDAGAVAELARRDGLDAPLVPGLPYVEAEVVWAAQAECALTVDDVLARRTRLATELPDGGRSLVPAIEALLDRATAAVG